MGISVAVPGVGPQTATQNPRRTRLAALAIGGLLLCVYLLTMGGHTSSVDEESMFYVADSILTKGNFSVPSAAAAAGSPVAPGVDGNNYAPNGIMTSAMLVPFVALGYRIAEYFPSVYTPFLLRMTANLLDVLVTVATALLCFTLALQLGYAHRVSVVLTLVFGLSTLAWPYSKYLWSEPVTALWLLSSILLLFKGTQQSRWILALGSGICLGLAIASKVTTAISLIGFVLYYAILLAEGWRRNCSLRMPCKQLIAFSCGLLLFVVIIGLYNYERFGNLIQTGYAGIGYGNGFVFDIARYNGLQGLLLSPGKSIFVYVPVAILFIPGVILLARTRAKESVLMLSVVASHILVIGSFQYWHGDWAWGPRYLVPVTALLVLPAGALLQGDKRHVMRAALAITAGLGVLVQLGGVLVNYDTYILITNCCGRSDAESEAFRYYVPANSPALQHWDLWLERVGAWRQYFRDGPILVSGFYPGVDKLRSRFPRMTDGVGQIDVPVRPNEDLHVRLRLEPIRPPSSGPSLVAVTVNRRVVPGSFTTLRAPSGVSGDGEIVDLVVPGSWITEDDVMLEIFSNTWTHSNDVGSSDDRTLGVLVTAAEFEQEGRALPPVREPLVNPFPVASAAAWTSTALTWFILPENAHLFDSWLWYGYFSGITPQGWPLAQTLLIVVALLLLGAISSGLLLLRYWRTTW